MCNKAENLWKWPDKVTVSQTAGLLSSSAWRQGTALTAKHAELGSRVKQKWSWHMSTSEALTGKYKIKTGVEHYVCIDLENECRHFLEGKTEWSPSAGRFWGSVTHCDKLLRSTETFHSIWDITSQVEYSKRKRNNSIYWCFMKALYGKFRGAVRGAQFASYGSMFLCECTSLWVFFLHEYLEKKYAMKQQADRNNVVILSYYLFIVNYLNTSLKEAWRAISFHANWNTSMVADCQTTYYYYFSSSAFR